MGFDLNDMDIVSSANDGAKCVLRHPATGEELFQDDGSPVYLLLAGSDSNTYREAQNRVNNARLNRKSGTKITVEDIVAEQLTVLCECTLGWGGMIMGGVELPFDRKSVRGMYEKCPPFKEQAEAFILDRANYLRD
jgi:hypothetical protein